MLQLSEGNALSHPGASTQRRFQRSDQCKRLQLVLGMPARRRMTIRQRPLPCFAGLAEAGPRPRRGQERQGQHAHVRSHQYTFTMLWGRPKAQSYHASKSGPRELREIALFDGKHSVCCGGLHVEHVLSEEGGIIGELCALCRAHEGDWMCRKCHRRAFGLRHRCPRRRLRLRRREGERSHIVPSPAHIQSPFPRPQTRGDCLEGGMNAARPCPYVGCRHHLYLDVNPGDRSIKLNFPGLDLEDLPATCVLDVVDEMRQAGLKEVSIPDTQRHMNLWSEERVRQITTEALEKLRVRKMREARGLVDLRVPPGARRAL